MKTINLIARVLPATWLPVWRRRILLGLFVALLGAAPSLASAQTVEWLQQLGTIDWDESRSVSTDGLGNVYISGGTWGSLGGTIAGGDDAFVSKYDASGTLLWTEQLGTSSQDPSSSVSADGLGNVYFSGWTWGSLGGPNAGYEDAFVGKIARVLGDANHDDVVDADDAAVLATYWLTAFGATWEMGDFNGDYAVNDIDATLMAANWGVSWNAAVPEPSTFVGLLGLCLAGLLGSARRRALNCPI